MDNNQKQGERKGAGLHVVVMSFPPLILDDCILHALAKNSPHLFTDSNPQINRDRKVTIANSTWNLSLSEK